MSGEMLDHGTHPAGLVSAHGGLGVFGDLLGVAAKRTVTDGTVGITVGHIGVRSEVDGDPEVLHLLGTLLAQRLHLLGCLGSGQFTGRRHRADEILQARHPAALLVDTHGSRNGAGGDDVMQRTVRQHLLLGPAADEDAADVMVAHQRTGVVGVFDADHE
ncbi:Uncharacterised protein [Mycobacteroides abscessus]|nr:Uncharacterised protein [Mycobacteroides abscessus]